MSNLKIEKHCLTSRRNIGTCDSDVNGLSRCKLVEPVDPWFRNSAELRRAMCNVGGAEAAMCRPAVAMLARVTRLLGACGGGGTHCNELRLVDLRSTFRS
jgi:hypothetical protein